MIESLKPLYNATLRPAALLCLKIGITPNHVTVGGLLFFIGAGVATAHGRWMTALILVIAGSLMDGLDGVLAREGGKTTTFGSILDSSCDRLTEMALLGGLLYYYQHSPRFSQYGPLLCYGALCSSVMISYIKARCEGCGISCSRGIMQRPERLILLCAGLISGPLVMVYVLAALLLLGTVTMFQRFVQAARRQ